MAKCVITYKGVKYPYEDFAEKLHGGLLQELIKEGIINESKLNGKQENAVNGKKPIGGTNEEVGGEDKDNVKTTKLKTSKSRIQRKIKEPNRIKAAKIEVDNAYDLVMQHFIGGGYIDRDSLKSFLKGSEKETFARQNLTLKLPNYDARYAPNMKDLAHSLWEDNQEQYPQFNTEDYYNALEEVLLENLSPIQMAKDLIKKTSIENINRQEELLAGIYEDKEVDPNKADAVIDYLEGKTTEEIEELLKKDKWEEGTDIVINENPDDVFQKVKEGTLVYHGGHINSSKDYAEGDPIYVSPSRSQAKQYAKGNGGSTKAFLLDKENIAPEYVAYNFMENLGLKSKDPDFDNSDLRNNASIYELIDNRFETSFSDSDIKLLFKKMEDSGYTGIEFTDYNLISGRHDINNMIIFNPKKTLYRGDDFQKESTKPSVYSQKVMDKLQKAMPKVKIVFDANLKAAGKWSPSTNTITINPEYAGKDTAIHEAGHILIDAMGYDNKIIQSAIKQLRGTDLYTETKKRYPELNDEQLDKEVLAEAIGREGAEIFDNIEDRSKFKAYLDYIFDWLKQKLGLDKNVAKSLAKQIIGGVKTKELEGVTTSKEQLQKEKTKKSPIGVKPLSFTQYAVEHGFSYETETAKIDEASALLDDAKEAEQDALVNGTKEEYDIAAAELKAAKKAFAIAGKRSFEYKQYKKDFYTIQEILNQKDLSKYTVEELQDLITKVHGFDNKAAKAIKEEAMLKLAFLVRQEIKDIHKKRDNYIESVADSKDITSLQKVLLHISHFTEYQPEMQKLSLEFGKAVMDKISDASTRKGVHEKLAHKVIAEENKKLGIVGSAATRFSSDSAKYFDWMVNEDGNLLTVEEAQKKGLSEAKINYLKFTRETIADYKEDMTKDNFENTVMEAIKVDKGFQEAFKSEGLLEAFSYYLGGGGYNLGKVRIEHNGTIKSYAEIEKEILANTDRKSITSILSGLWELLKANVKARRQLKKGYNIDESVNPLEIKGEAEYSLNNKGQLVSKFDKPRAKDRGYSKDFYRAMNQFIDESAHVKHMSKIMPLVESVEYLNKKGYMEKGIMPKKNVAKWIEDWKALHIFKEPYVNDPVLDASIKFMRKLVASTTMWFNIPANIINVATGNYNNWRQENGKTLVKGNARLFGGKGERGAHGVVNRYALDIIKKYNIVNQDYDSQPTLRATNIFAKIATIGTQLGEYQIQGSLALGLMSDNVYNSFEYKKDKYGNDVLMVKDGINEDDIKKEILKIKNRVTDIQGKYPDEDRRNIMRGEIGKAVFQFKVWMPDWFRERFAPEYYNAFGERKEGTLRALYKDGFKKIKDDLKSGNFKELAKNKAFMSNLKGLMVITALLVYKYQDDDDDETKGKMTLAQNLLGQVLFVLDPEQDKYMVSNPIAVLGKTKDFINAAEAIITLDEKAWDKTKRVLPANKLSMGYELGKKIIK